MSLVTSVPVCRLIFVPSYIVGGTVIGNGVCLEEYSYDLDLTNNCSFVQTGVGVESDLEMIKASTPGPIIAGEDIEYTLEVHNKGPSDARGVILGDVLPAGLVFVSATPTQGTCDFDGSTILCNIGYVSVGQRKVVTIVAFVPPTTLDGTIIENTACIVECGHDLFNDNDCSTVRNTIRHIVQAKGPEARCPGACHGLCGLRDRLRPRR